MYPSGDVEIISKKRKSHEKVTSIGLYKLGETIGKGSFCKVKLATHAISGEQFAVKIMHVSSSNPHKWNEIEREIEVLHRLNHPNIIKMYQVLYTDENDIRGLSEDASPSPSCILYMVMELAEGGELFDYIIRHTRLNEDEARRLFRQMVSAVEYMHAHLVVHRDLKPENIVMDAQKNIKINDFGLSNYVNPGVRMSTFCGSPVYAAPEIVRKKNYDGPSVDIWSLGVILYTMVTGHLPWKPNAKNLQNLHDMMQGKFTVPNGIFLSPECLCILKKMLCPDPRKRATIQQLREHPWVNEGYPQYPPSYLEAHPPLPNIDEEVIKKMAQMGYNPKKVVDVLARNRTGPVLTTYHTLKMLKENCNGHLVKAFASGEGKKSTKMGPWLKSFALNASNGADVSTDGNTLNASDTIFRTFSYPESDLASSSSSTPSLDINSSTSSFESSSSLRKSQPIAVGPNAHNNNHNNHNNKNNESSDEESSFEHLSASVGVTHSKSIAEPRRRRANSTPSITIPSGTSPTGTSPTSDNKSSTPTKIATAIMKVFGLGKFKSSKKNNASASP